MRIKLNQNFHKSSIASVKIDFDEFFVIGNVLETLCGTDSKIITSSLGFLAAICVASMELIKQSLQLCFAKCLSYLFCSDDRGSNILKRM